MTTPIVRLFGLFIVLFGLLVFFTSRWTVFEADALRDNPKNRRALLEEARVKRGLVKARDGTVLARSVRAPGDTWRRVYPVGDLFPHAVGYSFTNTGRAGIEKSHNDDLVGADDDVTTLLRQLSGKAREGDDLVTTLDPKAQRVAYEALAGRKGSVVALEPRTGKVRVLASLPRYDSNDVDTRFRALARQPGSPMLNRATQGTYPPGSTFKVVTAVAAIDSGLYTPGSTVDGRSPKVIGGVPLSNSGGQNFGTISLTAALTQSVNTVWAEVALKVGKQRMADYMTKFGFYKRPPLDYPANQLRPSGEYGGAGLLNPLSDRIELGRMGIGQDKLGVTPLQMAMVAGAVANDGKLMRPTLGDRVIDEDGRIVERFRPDQVERVMKKTTADAVASMMSDVVREGTGTSAALSGIDVAGKSGTAERDPSRDITQPWFIAFAPVREPRIAVAATIEQTQGGFGGTVAAPIARQVMEALL